MYAIPATPVHCFAQRCPHRDPLRCLMRVPPFYITKPKPGSSVPPTRRVSSTCFDDASDCSSSQHPQSKHSAGRDCDRLAKSRATGQSYRDNERQHIFRLITAVENGRLENSLLFVMFTHAYKRQRAVRSALPPVRASLRQLPCDTTEDWQPYMTAILYPLSEHSQALLGQRMISGAMATVLLELLMHRRNMWGTTHAMHAEETQCDHTDRRRRRRPPYRTATTARDANSIVQFAIRQFSRERVMHHRFDQSALHRHVQRRLGHLTMAAHKLDECEATRNAVYCLSDYAYDQVQTVQPPASPTTPDAAEFGSWLKMKRTEGAKRCSRCGVLKITGSGHARSKCADGLSISSHVPYPSSSLASDEEHDMELDEVHVSHHQLSAR